MQLDARDRKLLAAFRDEESPPPGVARRCYEAVLARIEDDDLEVDAAPPVPWLKSIAISFSIAAAVLLMMRGTVVVVAGLRADATSAVHVQAEHVEGEALPTRDATIETPPAPRRAPAIAPTPEADPAEAEPSVSEPSVPEPPPPAASTPKKRVAAAGLDADLALLTAAKRATDPAARLKLLEQHARDHQASTFAEERDVLLIETLCALHRESDAKSRATAFLSRHPRSAFAARVQKSCAAAGG